MKKKIQLPFDEPTIRSLKIGDQLLLSGTIFTGRDCVHKMLSECISKDGHLKEAPFCLPDLSQGVLYHCGPVVISDGNGNWEITAAGPTTSIREEPYMSDIIRAYGIRAVIGKGGLGANTTKACQKYGCVYLHAVGGAAQVLAKAIKKVRTVYGLQQFGVPEAIWELEVKDFPVIVTMDSHGDNEHTIIKAQSSEKLLQMLGNACIVK